MRSRLCVILIALFFSTFCAAQHRAIQHQLNLKLVITDYNSLDPVYRTSSNRFLHPDAVNYATELGYRIRITPSFSFSLPLRIGAIDAHHNLLDLTDSLCSSNPCEKRYFKNEFFAGTDLLGHFHFANGYMLAKESLVQPYVFAGMGVLYMEERSGNFDLQAPLGLGVDLQLNPQIALQGQFEYRPSFLIQKNNLAISLGINFLLNAPSPIPVSETKEPPITDRDMDGVLDIEDDCPDASGLVQLQGCPDDDADGVKNSDDDCPTVFGLAAFNGCPDTDQDGIPNQKDDCPELAGPIANQGCPKEILLTDKVLLKEASVKINFEPGNAVLLNSSKPTLDKIAALMQRYPQHQLRILGHTDNVGGATVNLLLSRERAKACFEYLKNKGVADERMHHKGYGEMAPLAPNDTAAGRASNRRVEFILFK